MNKSIFKSKTIWVSLLLAIAPVFPPVQIALLANPEIAGIVVGGIMAALRLITTKPVSVGKK